MKFENSHLRVQGSTPWLEQKHKTKMGNSDTIIKKLEGFIMTPNELADKMASGDFHFYQPVDMKALEQEAINEGMSPEIFRMSVFHHLRERFLRDTKKTASITAHQMEQL